ncbi:unnamed protein product [Staurois parvus]|uniref:Uncharacterized protein n=1 Tax=Staurois parvus TaxID=386267 RepID=A0ABN9BUM6_9NEOB|nr:unnamed protein product [Staurois parvus]
MAVLTGEKYVLFTHRPLPFLCSSVITGCWRGISGRDPVIDSCSRQWTSV